jgi:hypothetical protein
VSADQWNPGKLLELSGGYWKTCALHTAVKLDVFEIIGDGRRTATDVSHDLEASERGISALLNALCAMHLLRKTGQHYANLEIGRTLLSSASDAYIGHMILHHHHLMAPWAHLHEAVRTGEPIRGRSMVSPEDWRASFLMGMYTMASLQAPHLVQEIDLQGHRHLLDLGGGPGTYAIHFCRFNPELTATVYDLASSRPFAERTIERFEMQDRVAFQDGDYLEQTLTGRYDVAWLSHILHGEGPDDCRNILRKTAAVLDPGGMVLVHEFILDDTMDGPLFPALFALNMLQGTSSGRAYAESQLKEMLHQAGFTDLQRLAYRGPTESGVITGHKP